MKRPYFLNIKPFIFNNVTLSHIFAFHNGSHCIKDTKMNVNSSMKICYRKSKKKSMLSVIHVFKQKIL